MSDRFEVLELLGQGGNGAVYAAIDHKLNKRVALKRIGDAVVPPRWPRHRSLVRTRGCVRHGGDRWFVMDFIEGRRLSSFGVLPADEALSLVAQIASALEVLHRAGLVHGDVKPDNVIVRADGVPVLVDCTAPRARFGTDGYRAPEVAVGAIPTAAADTFGLASTAVFLLTGATPDATTTSQRNALSPSWRLGLATDPARRPAPAALVGGVAADAPVHLPAYLTSFIGRVQELATLSDQTRTHRVVTVTGVGGMGKTRLCVEFARARASRFPGGVYFARAATATLDDVADAMGMRRSRDFVTDLAARLGELPSLLVLDTAEEPPADVAAAIRSLVRACPRLVVLIAARMPVARGLGMTLPLLPMPPTDARALARDRGRGSTAATSGVPLVIELDQLDAAHISRAVEIALGRLAIRDRRAVERLRCFEAPFSVGAARAAVGVSAAAIERLRSMGIVAPAGDRLRLVDLVAQCTVASPPAQTRLREWIASEVSQGCTPEAVDHGADALAHMTLDDEWLARVLVALGSALVSRNRGEAVEAVLDRVIANPGEFPKAFPVALRTAVDNWRRYVDVAEQYVEDLGDEALRAVVEMRRLGQHASETEDVEALRRIIRRLDGSGDDWFLCGAWAELGVNLANLDQTTEGVAALRTAAVVAERVHNHWVAGMAHNALGILAGDKGNTAEAQAQALAAIAAFERLAHPRRVAEARANLAAFRMDLGDFDGGFDLAEVALTEAAEIGARNIVGRVLFSMAIGFVDRDPERALALAAAGRAFTRVENGRGAAEPDRLLAAEARARAALGPDAEEIVTKSRELDIPAAVAIALAP